MARIKIEEPESYIFEAYIKTRITDLNYGGHVGNDRIFAFMHDARAQFFKSLGFKDELSFGAANEKIGTIQTDAAITYKAELFAHESITIKIGLLDFNKYGCDFVYRFEKDCQLIALGKTGIVFYDYTTKKITTIPLTFKNKVQ